jgi:hypothetical protein
MLQLEGFVTVTPGARGGELSGGDGPHRLHRAANELSQRHNAGKSKVRFTLRLVPRASQQYARAPMVSKKDESRRSYIDSLLSPRQVKTVLRRAPWLGASSTGM